jgi:hypothetical protein
VSGRRRSSLVTAVVLAGAFYQRAQLGGERRGAETTEPTTDDDGVCSAPEPNGPVPTRTLVLAGPILVNLDAERRPEVAGPARR